MAQTTISVDFYKLLLASLKRNIRERLERECRDFAEKVIAEEIAKFTFSVEDLLSIGAGGRELHIRITREENP